ncbi:hypothetical protein EV127DRAFT_160163 [Xylaria flabelliformis]|nr:hypothetical protein EV127DRAFT_160163 [Xylaria flabelliformis]
MDPATRRRSYVDRAPLTRIMYLNACKEIHGESLWGKFVAPEKIFEDIPVQQPSSILKLPLELLFKIMSLCSSVDTVCLALACKALLQSCYGNIPLIPSVAKHNQLGSKRMGIFTLLTRTRPMDARGQPTIYFMPCYACFHDNEGREYWKERRSTSPPDNGEVARLLSFRCPWCSIRAEV